MYILFTHGIDLRTIDGGMNDVHGVYGEHYDAVTAMASIPTVHMITYAQILDTDTGTVEWYKARRDGTTLTSFTQTDTTKLRPQLTGSVTPY